MANICYTLGPIVDFVRGAKQPSKDLFWAGLYFSLILTALPGIWAIVAWISTLVTGNKMD